MKIGHLVFFFSSYKRLNGGFCTSATVSWGIENRLVAVRIINPNLHMSPTSHSSHGLHLEMRVPGADANVYIAFSALLASGLYGIRHQLPLLSSWQQDSDTSIHPLPENLRYAIERMKHKDSVAYSLLPRDFIDHFIQTRLHECLQFEASITDWERSRYLELI
jgi:glutamine synthetase